MLLKEKTKEFYGYSTDELSPTSTYPVFWKCDNCAFERQFTMAYYQKKKADAIAKHDGVENCQKCGHAHRKNKTTDNIQKGSYYPLPPETDVNATMERFGYDPYTLSPWSRKRVMVRCKETGKLFSPKRCSLNRYKSIIETGHFYSIGAWTGKRRKGLKASETTLEKQRLSQKARRKKEKEQPNSPHKELLNSKHNPYNLPYNPKQ